MAEQNIDNINENELNEEELEEASGGRLRFPSQTMLDLYAHKVKFYRGQQVMLKRGSQNIPVKIAKYDTKHKPTRYAVYEVKNPSKFYNVDESELYDSQTPFY